MDVTYAGVDLVAGGVPCPPFSKAGKQLGADDARDLFPAALRVVDRLEAVRGRGSPQVLQEREVLSLGASRATLIAHLLTESLVLAVGGLALGLALATVTTRLLLGMGLREFSMHPAQLLSVKQEILNSDLARIVPQTRKIMRSMEPGAIADAVEQLQLM